MSPLIVLHARTLFESCASLFFESCAHTLFKSCAPTSKLNVNFFTLNVKMVGLQTLPVMSIHENRGGGKMHFSKCTGQYFSRKIPKRHLFKIGGGKEGMNFGDAPTSL